MKSNNILITGAESGIGKAIKDAFEANGACVTNLPRTSIMDGTYLDVLQELMRTNTWDTLVLNFGTNHLSWIGTTPKEDIRILNYNVWVPYSIVNELKASNASKLPKQIIMLSSSAATTPMRCSSLYCASKAAVDMLVKCMNRELQPYTRVLGIAPGMVEGTEMYQKVTQQVPILRGWTDDQQHKYAKSLVPARRYTTPNEVAEFVVKVTELPEYVSGTTLKITGGL